ncbi:MAG: putative chitinase [Acidobacteriota bacterium]|jgi:hypothetical protein|nr:putative chitinase [Acidobacteriota bacterium]
MFKFDNAKFWAAYKTQFGHLPHATEKKSTQNLLGFIAVDPNLQRIEWAAYLLGTMRNEVGASLLPIKENKAAPNTEVWKKYQSKYWNTGFYGRGYAQLTWKGNYQKFSRLLGMGDQLVSNPDLVLQPKVGYDILSIGCVQGLFRSRPRKLGGKPYKLADFLTATKKDYVSARNIVNGVSGTAYKWALRVGAYSQKYEACLRAAEVV